MEWSVELNSATFVVIRPLNLYCCHSATTSSVSSLTGEIAGSESSFNLTLDPADPYCSCLFRSITGFSLWGFTFGIKASKAIKLLARSLSIEAINIF